MARNSDKKVYLSPAIPRDSRLWELIRQKHLETGIPESQLLVLFASEYARLSDGTITTAQAQVPSLPSVQKNAQTPFLQGPSEAEINFDSFGDPD